MPESDSAALARSPGIGLIRSLIERRVPHAVGIYAGASWGLMEFTDAIVVQRLLFSTHYVDLVLLATPLLLPSVILLAWFHGKSGRDRETLPRTEKIGIPANMALCGIVLWAAFAGTDLGRMTTAVTVTDEEGEVVEREIVKPEFRKSVAMFPFDLGPGAGEDDAWLAYAVPIALELDLLADDFFIPRGGVLDRNEVFFRDRLVERGFADLRGVPLTLKREVGEEVHAEFLTDGEIDRTGDLYRAALRVYRVDDGSLEGETVHEGTDLLALVDELSVSVKQAVGIPAREGVEDLPVRARLSDDDAAVEALFQGLEAAFARADFAAAIELTEAATARDPTFAAAQYVLALYLQLANRGAAAVARIAAALEHEYRLPERVRLGVKKDYYGSLGDLEKAAAAAKMWADLYPDDLLALVNYKELQVFLGDKEGALATLEAMRDLDPRNGDLLQEIARVHEDLGNDEQALQAQTDYVASFPEDAAGYAGLAALRKRLGDYEAARDLLDAAILLEPFSAALPAQLAALELDAGNFADAWAGYERALEAARTPEQRAEVLLGIVTYHRRRGEVVLAGEAWEMWQLGASGLSSFEFSLLYESPESADLEAVREVYRRLEAMGIPDPILQRFRGALAELAGDYVSAAEHYRQAMALDRSRNLHGDAGRALRLAGQLGESETELTEALRLVPGDPKAHFEMALLLETQGDLDGAAEHLGSALAAWENADEDYEPARQARAKLEELRER